MNPVWLPAPRIQFTPPTGFVFRPPNAGNDPFGDSNVDSGGVLVKNKVTG